MGSDRVFLETACGECLIQVLSWGESEWREVTVTVFSEHLPLERWRWLGRNGRFRTAWRVLRRGWHDPELEFDSRQELDAFLDALVKAYAVAFDGSIGLLRQSNNTA